MNSGFILVAMFTGLVALMLTGLPLAFVLGGMSLLFTVVFWDPGAIVITVIQIFDTMRSEALLAIPLYILMACLLGILFYLAISLAERLLMPWHVSFRRERA